MTPALYDQYSTNTDIVRDGGSVYAEKNYTDKIQCMDDIVT